MSRPLSASGIAITRRSNPIGPPVKDATFYRKLLEQKLQAVIAETKSLERKTKECYAILEREPDVIQAAKAAEENIERLKQQLFDINESIEQMRLKSKMDNTGDEDILRTELSTIENECERLLARKHELTFQLESRKEEKKKLDSELRTKLKGDTKEFDRIKSDMFHMTSEISKNRELLESLRQDIRSTEAKIKANPNISKSIDLEAKLERLQSENAQLESDIQLYSKPAHEQRDLILQYVKDMNAENMEIENVLKKLTAELSRNEETIFAMKSGNKERAEKYQYLSTKRAEIEDYIRKLSEDNTNLEMLISSRQKEILSVTSQLNEIHQRERDKPEVELLSDDINNSRFTNDRLRAELVARRAELKRLDDIDAVYIQRSAELNQKIKVITEELHALENADAVREADNNIIETLLNDIQALKERIASERSRLIEKQSELSLVKAEVIDGTPFAKLLDIDRRLREIDLLMKTANTRLHESTFQQERKQLAESIRILNSLILQSTHK